MNEQETRLAVADALYDTIQRIGSEGATESTVQELKDVCLEGHQVLRYVNEDLLSLICFIEGFLRGWKDFKDVHWHTLGMAVEIAQRESYKHKDLKTSKDILRKAGFDFWNYGIKETDE